MKILTTITLSTITAATLLVSSQVWADEYETADTTTTTTTTNSSQGISALYGYYLGGDFTLSNRHPIFGEAARTSLPWKLSPGFRLYGGYQFTDNLAAELAYMYLQYSKNPGDALIGPDHTRVNGFALTGKASYAFSNGISAFASLGGAVVHQNIYNQGTASSPTNIISMSRTKLQPTFGLGLGYKLAPDWTTNFSWNHIVGMGKFKPINTYALGVSYYFN